MYLFVLGTLEPKLKTAMQSSCMMTLCLAQPCPLPLYSLPAHTVVQLCRVPGYGGIRSSCWLWFKVYGAVVSVTAVPALLRLVRGTLLPTDFKRRCTVGSLADTAVSAPFGKLFEKEVLATRQVIVLIHR